MHASELIGPHSRACGWLEHDHGPRCSENCPTCHGKEMPSEQVAEEEQGPVYEYRHIVTCLDAISFDVIADSDDFILSNKLDTHTPAWIGVRKWDGKNKGYVWIRTDSIIHVRFSGEKREKIDE